MHEFPQISQNLFHEIVMTTLGCYKFCARWVPKMLLEIHKNWQIASALSFLETYNKDDSLLDRIVKRDETWVRYINCDMKKSIYGIGLHLLT